MSQTVLTPAGTESAGQLADAELQGIVEELGTDRLCTNCNQLLSGETQWCQACGFYRALGTFVEAPAEEGRSAEAEALYTREWKRCALASSTLIVLVTVVSFAARFLTDPYTGARFWYSVAQICAGCLMLLSAHIAAWVWGLVNADDVKVADVVTNPIDVWRVTIEELPRSWRRTSIGVSGLLAVLLGFTVVEGVTLAHLTGTRAAPPRPKLMSTLTSEAVAAGSGPTEGQTLEEAIEEFAGHGEDVTDDAAKEFNPWDQAGVAADLDPEVTDEESDTSSVRPEISVTCVVVGYVVDDSSSIRELLIAAMHRGQLTYAAVVSDGVKERLPRSLAMQLPLLVQDKPPLVCPPSERPIVWVRPAAKCQIDCRGVRRDGQLVGAVLAGQ